MSDSRIPDRPPRKREGSSRRRLQRLLLVSGIVLFVAGIVATVGVPAFDIGLTDSPDEDSVGEPPGTDEPDEQDDGDGDADAETTEADDEADPSEDPPPDDGADDEETDEQEAMDADDETDATDEADEEDDEAAEDTYTYSATVEVEDADSGEPVEGVPVEFYPVDEESEQYTTDENGEVTIAFEHDAPDDTFEYVLAVGDGERIVEIEQGEQTEPVPLSSDPEEP